MTSLGPELLAESLQLVLYTVVAGVLTVGGVLVEQASLQHLGTGEAMIALWLGALGGLMLYAGAYGVGYQKVLSEYV
ncbi:hypothetical protein NP511_10615 [Natrinema thermotolerans]|uniref:DUF8151 domain-containing protein n=1 Tax=Natrinema thermotolerans TaxID=121872 RepID=A0AAF0PIJ7_9EURY|nr:hypothetical protein [Natrinema thermotolerans]ELZ15907.1 hypothetical protein C478_04194 [Natrinema thermotolerans DSM 11552]QCC58899.1 hypothetical protein DVR14_09760 [Natrinema thermotolerans]WMT10059.1 hypothetical protein NP511_10615 [Natrinema thermotolerans]